MAPISPESATPMRSRRAEYAETTRRAIIAAARELFARLGYTSTKIDDIAALARVSPATVSAVAGGKQGLLHTLIEAWTDAPDIDEANLAIESLDDPDAILDMDASLARRMHEDWGDVMHILLATAPLDLTAAASLKVATERYRAGLRISAVRLGGLGALKSGMTVPDATDVLWFYFGYTGYTTLMNDNGWSAERAQRWLRELAAHSLLRSSDRY